jgi:MFS family permease
LCAPTNGAAARGVELNPNRRKGTMAPPDEKETGDTAGKTEQLKVPQIPWVRDRLFYGWIIVLVGAATQFLQGTVNQGFTTYLGPLQRDFGWSRAVLAGPRSITSVQNSIFGPVEGFLMDRFGPRNMSVTGVFIMGLGLILFGLTNSLWMYYLANIVIALGTGFYGMLIMSVAVNNWFRRKRTIAQSVMLLGWSLAGVVGVPVVVLVQGAFGWEISAIGSGLIIWAVGIPTSLLLRTKPEPYGLLPDGDTVAGENATANGRAQPDPEHDFTLAEAIRTRTFWLISVGSAIGNLGMGTAQVHLFLHLEQGVGLGRTTAALVWTVASLSNIPSRLIAGFLGDRLPKNHMMGFAITMMALSVLVLAVATTARLAFVYAVLYGIGWGVRTPVMNAMQGEYFGRTSLGVISGWLHSLSLPLTIAAPVLAGYVADVQGTYRTTFIVVAVLMMVGAALMFVAARPTPPVREE